MKGKTKMKKTLVLASIIALALSSQCFAADEETAAPSAPAQQQSTNEFPSQPPSGENFDGNFQKPPKAGEGFNGQNQDFDKKKSDFEKKLKLTDEQKQKVKEIREKGQKQMEADMNEIKAKRDEISKIKNSFNSDDDKRTQIELLRDEVKNLNKKMHQTKVQNMNEFEGILNDKQLKTFEKMKENGRKNFEKNMKKRENGNGFGRGPEGAPPMGPNGGAHKQGNGNGNFPPPPPHGNR